MSGAAAHRASDEAGIPLLQELLQRLPPDDRDVPADERPDYRPLVFGSLLAALVLLAGKLLSLVALIVLDGISVRLKWWGPVPFASLDTDPETFVSVVAWSTIGMTIGTTVAVAVVMLRNRSSGLRVFGWGTGVLMSATTILLLVWSPVEAIPKLPNMPLLWSGIPILAGIGCVAAYVVLGGEHRVIETMSENNKGPSTT